MPLRNMSIREVLILRNMSITSEVTNMNAVFKTLPLFIPGEERIDKLPFLVHH